MVLKKLIQLFTVSIFVFLLIFQQNLQNSGSKQENSNINISLNDGQLFEGEITPLCDVVDNLNYQERDNINIALTIPDSRKWYMNVINAELRDNNRIPEEYKEKQFAYFTIKDIKNNKECILDSNVRISGDVNDHIDFNKLVTSLDVELLNDNLFGFTNFKLFLPKARYLDNEIFISTFLKNLGYLAPTSFYINVEVNGVETIYIFQEKINKILVESNNLKEGPILEAYENIAWGSFGWFTNNTILPPKIINKTWLKKSNENIELAKHSIEKVYKLLIYGVDNDDYNFLMCENCLLNYDTLNKVNSDYFKEYQLLNTILRAHRGINFSDRKFYLDPITDFLYPVYYDGTAELLEYNSDSDLWELTKFSLGEKEHLSQIPVVNLTTENIENLRAKVNKFNYSTFEQDLIGNGISVNRLGFSEKDFKKFISDNLNLYLDNSYQKTNKDLSIYLSKNNVRKEQYYLLIEEDEQYKLCEVDLINCEDFYLSKESLIDVLSGDFIYEDRLVFYIGNRETLIQDTHNPFINYKNLKIENMNYSFKFIGDAEFLYYENVLFIDNPSNDFRLIIDNQTLENQKIVFTSNYENIQYSKTSLTGCITIYNSFLVDFNFYSENSSCEDAINIINSYGTINSIEVNNSMFDGLDLDFSKVKIDALFISNAGNDCADFSYGEYYIYEANLMKCGDKAISVGENSLLEVERAISKFSNTGLAAKDSSFVSVNYFDSIENNYCFVDYRKKQEFGSAVIDIKNLNCG